ncbi:hypothetical protein [Kribbella sp. NPDC003557]|uniref:hypothetical protein n=1 Tax=Kribbella sp. NPDC003557 TaxID=3154449 RepID=UPI0033B3B3EB
MTAKYHLIIDPDLLAELRDLQARAKTDPNGPAAQQFEAVRRGLSALREGREDEFAGERLGRSDNHSDLRDCAEIKIPVVQEFNRRGRPMGPSHRLTYREFEGPSESHLPVRQVIAFAPRKDSEIFTQTAIRLGRTRGVALDELDHLPTVRPAVGPGKEADRPIAPPRLPLPPDLTQALKALEGLPPPTTTTPKATTERRTTRHQPPSRGPSQSK